eukprot:750365-Rhodomonas_salina.2
MWKAPPEVSTTCCSTDGGSGASLPVVLPGAVFGALFLLRVPSWVRPHLSYSRIVCLYHFFGTVIAYAPTRASVLTCGDVAIRY